MSTIASLNVLLTAQTAPFAKGINTAVSTVAEGANSIRSGIGSMVGFALGPIGLAIGAIAGIGESLHAAGKNAEVIKKLDAVLMATGNTTGFARSQLLEMAEDLQKVTNFSARTTTGAEAMLATFHGITGDTFKSALKSAMDLTSVMGGDLNENIVKVGRALDNPIAGMKSLSRLGVTFTEQQKDSIKTMASTGNLGGAQQAILSQLQGKFGGAAEAMASPFVQFKNRLENLAESVGAILLPIANTAMKIFGPMVSGIADTLKPILPVVQNVMQVVGNLFEAGIQFLGSVIQPAWQAFTGFLGTAFDGFLNYLEAMLPAALEMLGGFFDTALAFGEMLWQGLEIAFTSIANVIGLSSASSSKSLAGLGSIVSEIGADIQAVLLVLEFGFTHWQELGALALVSVEFGVVRLGNQIEYFFGTMMPGYLSWFGNNWRNIFTDAANIVATIASNIWENIKSLWDAIVGLFQGKGFDFQPTNLLKGFESALTQMPQIAARVAGQTETALGAEMQGVSDKLNQSFGTFINERTAQNVAAAQKLHDSVHSLFDSLKHPKLPAMPSMVSGLSNQPGKNLLTSDTSTQTGALVKGSAEAYKVAHTNMYFEDLKEAAKEQTKLLGQIADNTKGAGGGDPEDMNSIP